MDWFSWLSKTNLEPSLTYEYGLAFSKNELQWEDIRYFNHEFLQSMGISVAKHRLEILKLARKEQLRSPKSLNTFYWALGKTKKCFSKYFNKLVSHEDMSASFAKDLPEPIKYQEQWRRTLLRKQRSENVKEEIPIVKPKSIAFSGPLDGRVNERLMGCSSNNNNNNNNTRRLKLSGPIDGKAHERLMYTNKSTFDGRPPVHPPSERLMMNTIKSPRICGFEDGRVQERYLMTSKSPRVSGPLDERLSPKFIISYDKESLDFDYDDNSLWTGLFQDMKPT